MMKNMKFLSVMLILGIAMPVMAAPSIPPAMLAQFQAMSPSEKEALAKQYGVALPAAKPTTETEMLAKPAEALPQTEKTVEDMPVKAKPKNILARYGQALFDRKVSTFAPTDNALVPNDYRIGVGDELVVQLFGKENSLTSLQVIHL